MASIRIIRYLRNLLDVNTAGGVPGDALTLDVDGVTWVPGAGGGGGGGAPTTADYLVGTADGTLSAEIVVGATPGGELGGTWASPTVDAVHSGSSHAATQSAAEATAAAGLAAHEADPTAAHAGTAISNTPAGTLAATNVQAALNELGTEKAAEALAVMDGDVADGDLTGTYPNPTLDAIGAAAGPIGDGTNVAAVTIDTKGRVTALTAVPITGAPPSGGAGGVLSGTYPNPGFAVDMATQAELDALAALAATDAELATHAALVSGVHGITAAAATVLDDVSVAAMRATLGAGVPLASDPLADVKGDTFAATAADAIARVPVGTDGQVLTADAASAPGVKWAAAAGGGAPTTATYITQVADAGLSAEQALSALATGLVKNTTGTGVLSIGAQGTDFYAPGGTDVAVADGGTGASTAAAARTNLDVPSNAEAVLDTLYDANTVLAADADNTPAALTMAASTILARLAAGNIKAATPAELRTLLSLVIGTNVEAWDADLDAIAALTSAADKLPYATGAQVWALTTLTAFARTVLDDADAATALATLQGISTTLVNAKGDVLVGSADDTVARLGVGGNGLGLVASSYETLGVGWSPVNSLDTRPDAVYDTLDRAVCGATRALTAGHVYLCRVWLPGGFTLSNIDMWVQGAAAAPTNTYVAICAYSSSGGTGARLAVSADVSATLTTTAGKKSFAISYSVLTSGYYWLAFLQGGGTGPSIIVQNTAVASIFYTDSPPFAAKDATSGRTSIPDPVTPSDTLGGLSFLWMRAK